MAERRNEGGERKERRSLSKGWKEGWKGGKDEDSKVRKGIMKVWKEGKKEGR